jgi:hypothetical protein
MRPARIATPKFQNLAVAIDVATATYLGYELSLVYRGTHPVLSHRLAEYGLWPRPSPAVKEGARQGGEDSKEADVRWMSINGVPVPASFDALTFWKRG